MQNKEIRIFDRVEPWWRLLNMTTFIATFFGPWGTIYGGIMYGTDMFLASFAIVIDWILADYSGYWLSTALYYCFGWICFGLYWLLNIARVFGKRNFWKSRWFNILLVVNTMFLLFDAFPRIFRDPYNRFWWWKIYWGYWLLLCSMGSSIVVEVIRDSGVCRDQKRLATCRSNQVQHKNTLISAKM